MILNTPESIDAWIAERKKRWPSKQNVEEKKKREQEAVQRGEINPSDLSRSTAKGMRKRRLGNNEENRHRSSQSQSQSHKRARTDVRSGDNQTQQSLGKSSSVGGTSRAKKEVGVPSFTAAGSNNPINPATDNYVNSLPSSHVLNTILSSSEILDKEEEEKEEAKEAKDDDNADEDDSQSSSDVDPVRDAISSKGPVDIPEEYPSVAIVEEQDEIGQSTLQKHQVSLLCNRETIQMRTGPSFFNLYL